MERRRGRRARVGQRAVTAIATDQTERKIDRERTRLKVREGQTSDEIELEEDGGTFTSPLFEG